MLSSPGVDACNTVLEVVLFAAAMNLGQTWNTVLTLFGGVFRRIDSDKHERLLL